MELVDILVLGTSAARRAGSNPAEGIHSLKVAKYSQVYIKMLCLAEFFCTKTLFFN